jgi:hypothetical protein
MSKRKTLEERFWSKVDKRGPDECWPWLASEQVAITSTSNVSFRRVAWELANPPHPEPNSKVFNVCGFSMCANPRHLFRPTLEDRFWPNVQKTSGCWNWIGAEQSKGRGYGTIGKDGKTLRAHRVSWEMHNGPIPEGLIVCHKCDNPKCVRPEHLFLGTHSDNVADKVAKGRQSKGPAFAKVMRDIYAKKRRRA